MRRLSAEGITVMLSSHQMTDVEELCNRVAIINRGRILYEGAVAELKRSLGTWYRLRTVRPRAARARLAEGFDLGDVAVEGDELRFSGEEAAVERFMIALGRHEHRRARARARSRRRSSRCSSSSPSPTAARRAEPAPALEPVS